MPVSQADNAVMAKARGLYGKRLKAQDYETLLQKHSVAEIAGYLKNETYYGEALKEVKEELVHR
jgi:V/A-type H+-transporting ATPase subunit C